MTESTPPAPETPRGPFYAVGHRGRVYHRRDKRERSGASNPAICGYTPLLWRAYESDQQRPVHKHWSRVCQKCDRVAGDQ